MTEMICEGQDSSNIAIPSENELKLDTHDKNIEEAGNSIPHIWLVHDGSFIVWCDFLFSALHQANLS